MVLLPARRVTGPIASAVTAPELRFPSRLIAPPFMEMGIVSLTRSEKLMLELSRISVAVAARKALVPADGTVPPLLIAMLEVDLRVPELARINWPYLTVVRPV